MSYGLPYERPAVVVAGTEGLDLIGEPAGTRTQGPRLKSSNERFLTSARYRNGFPTIRCNIEGLVHSIDSIRSRLFPSFPAGFCHKIHHRVSTYKR
jgi:hypothetical protein